MLSCHSVLESQLQSVFLHPIKMLISQGSHHKFSVLGLSSDLQSHIYANLIETDMHHLADWSELELFGWTRSREYSKAA